MTLRSISWLRLPANLALPYLRNRKIVYGDLDDSKMRMGERARFDPIMSVLSYTVFWRNLRAQTRNPLIFPVSFATLDIKAFWWTS